MKQLLYRAGRKLLSVLLSVVMLLTAFAVAVPEKAAAASHTLSVSVSISGDDSIDQVSTTVYWGNADGHTSGSGSVGGRSGGSISGCSGPPTSFKISGRQIERANASTQRKATVSVTVYWDGRNAGSGTYTWDSGVDGNYTQDTYRYPSNTGSCSISVSKSNTTTYVKTSATCTVAAVYYQTCSVCGAKASSTWTGSALGHSWGSWSKISDTQHRRTCSRDSSHTETGNHTGGTATCTAAKTCSTCKGTYGSSLGHSWGSWTKISETQHKRTCTRDSSHTETGNHTGGTATCTAAKTCSTCNSGYGSALGHSWGSWTKINDTQHKRTCTRDSSHTEVANHSGGTATCTAAKVCSTCSSSYGSSLGHDFSSQTATSTYLKTAANCVDKAVYYYKCSRCSEKGTNTYQYGSVNSGNHKTTENRAAVAPTCTEVGYEAGVFCTACNTWASGHAQVAALGHSWGSWITDTNPTCSATGTKHRICSRCSAREDGTIEIVPTAHNWAPPSYAWSLDGKTCTATRTCTHSASHVESETANITNGQVTGTVKTQPTCLAKGWTTYSATFTNSAFAAQSTDREDIDMLPHSYSGEVLDNENGTHQKKCVNGCGEYGPAENCTYGVVTYTWAADGKTCTASHTCSVCGNVETEAAMIANHKISSSVKVQPTCSAMGTTTYTAVFSIAAFESVSKDVVDIAINPNAHNYRAPSYVFADDGHTCTATRVCEYDDSHVETETATLGNGITGELEQDSTCLEAGTTKYTATFANTAFEDQIKYVIDVNPKAHTYTGAVKNNGDGTHSYKCIYGCEQYGAMIDGEPLVFADGGFVSCDDTYGDASYAFTADGTQCTAQRTCGVCGYVQSETVNSVKSEKIAATCSAMGTSTYTATFTNPAFEVQTTDRVDIAINPNAHGWAAPTYDFAADGATCTATRICEHNNEHIETETASLENGKIVSAVKTEPTCLVKGWTTYTASFDNAAFAQQVLDVQDIVELPHVYSGPVKDNDDGTHSFQCINGCEEYGATVSCDATYGEISYDWAADGSTCTGSRECQVCGYVQSEEATVASEITTPATCMEMGKTTYTATFDAEGPFSTQVTTLVDVAIVPTAHKYGAVSIVFSEDGHTCTATRICEYNEEHIDTETVTAAAEVKIPATCVEKGWTTYTATFENPAFMLDEQSAERVTEREDLAIDPYNHASVLAKTPAKAPLCEEEGNNDYWYCASCEKYFSDAEGTTVTTVEEQTLAALGHDWRFASFDWAEDDKSAIVNLVCDHDSNHTSTVEAVMSTEVHEVTCTEDGYTIYTATYESDVEEAKSESRTVIDQVKLGHDYGTPTFTWDDDGHACYAERICSRDSGHVETETVTFGNGITGEVTTPATCIAMGTTTYTAVFENEAFMVEAQAAERVKACVDVAIDPANHATELIKTDAVAPTCLEEGNADYWYCESCDLYFSDAEGTIGIEIDGWIIPATGHFFEWKNDLKPTCMEEGYTAYQECSVCHFITGKEVLPIVDHEYYHVPGASGYVYDRSMQWNVYTCKYGCGRSAMLFTCFVRNDKGQALAGAKVRMNGGDIDEEVITDEDGIATFGTHGMDGVYALNVYYDGEEGVGEADGRFSLYDGKGSGGFGSISTSEPPEDPGVVDEPSTDPQQPGDNGDNGGNTNNDNTNTNPADNNNGNTDNTPKCKYCGGTHTGPFAWFINFLHTILAAFKFKK